MLTRYCHYLWISTDQVNLNNKGEEATRILDKRPAYTSAKARGNERTKRKI